MKTSKPSTLAQKSPLASQSTLRKTLIWQVVAIVFTAFLLYGQTIRYGYMVDDSMAILDNAVVKQGLQGIPTLLTKDSFYGFDQEVKREGQRKTYRPLSFIMFAIEWEFFPNKPIAGHIIHLSLYAALSVILFFLLRNLVKEIGTTKQHQFFRKWLPFLTALLFVVHPIHTEVVCNIKSRDEILALLGMLSALLLLVKSSDSGSLPMRFGAAFCCALGLLAKESAIGFLPIFPLALYFFRPALHLKQIATACMPVVLVSLSYLGLWFGVMGRVEETFYSVALTNPFVNASFAERSATAFWLIFLYLGKAIFPLTLSHSYTYNVIPIMNWSDWKPLLGLGLCVALAYYALSRTRQRDFLAFCCLFFACTIALASNLFIYVGGLLGERFIFTPSVASVLALVVLFVQLLKSERIWIFAAVGAVFIAYSALALNRITDWQSEELLNKADAFATPQSYQAQSGYAKALLKRSLAETNPLMKPPLMREALEHLEMARRIDSINDPQLYTNIGLCYEQLGDNANALSYTKQGYDKVLDAALYKGRAGYVCYAAKCYGQTILRAFQTGRFSDTAQSLNLLQDAAFALRTAIQRDTPTIDADVPMTLANCYEALSNYDSAMTFSEKAIAVKTSRQQHKDNYVIITNNYGGSLMQAGKYAEAAAVFARAVRTVENNARLQWGLGMAYFAAARYREALAPLRRAVELDPAAQRPKDDLARLETLLKNSP
jgi:tetratricopeptide (TPR) repeat protein